jgi:hypothetical protein
MRSRSSTARESNRRKGAELDKLDASCVDAMQAEPFAKR